MAVYRFRISFEDVEDVYREIDIQGKQNFEQFHRTIQEAIGFDNLKDASFFMSDDYWRKGQEIALNPPQHDDDDDDYRRPAKAHPKKMSESRIAGFIDDPHQHILYVYDPQVRWVIHIELMRIVDEDLKVMYPKTTKSVGAAPKQYKQVILPPVDEDDEDVEDDEEDKKNKNRAFTAEEEFEEDHDLEGTETDPDAVAEEGEAEAGGEEEASEEEGGDDFGFSDFGSEGGEDY
jgi:hypothetical protein